MVRVKSHVDKVKGALAGKARREHSIRGERETSRNPVGPTPCLSRQ